MTILLDEIYRLSYLARRLEPNQYKPPSIDKKPYTIEIRPKIKVENSHCILEKFNANHFVILKQNNPEELLLEQLTTIFGNMLEQTPVKGSTVYAIESTRSNTTSTKNNTYQPLHSDRNFKPNPPKVIALQCLQHSEQGGYTKLVYAKNIYQYVQRVAPNCLQNLFDQNATTFYRKDRNSKELRIIQYKKPIFYGLENDKVGISFNPMMSKIESTAKIEQLYRLISYFVSKPKNQLTFQLQRGETLVADNYALLHARTAFPADGGRLLRRAWYDATATKLELGFDV